MDKVYKFGGSSLADADAVARAVALIQQSPQPLAVVVSAMGGMTDDLLVIVAQAQRGEDTEPAIAAVVERLDRCAQALAGGPIGIEDSLAQLRSLLLSVRLTGLAGQEISGLISGFGEVWSAQLVAAALNQAGCRARAIDARDVLVATDTGLGVEVDWARSADSCSALENDAQTLVITGYIARTPDGHPTTLGRNGSDYSAAAFARLLGAKELHIFTDVSGMMSADPRLVPDARPLTRVSYLEAMELAYFGAGVLHPKTLQPLLDRQIPVWIRNTFEPEHPGTCVGPAEDAPEFRIKGVTAISHLALVSVEGSGMLGVPGTARRVFGALKRADVSVILISQASSEQSICFAVAQSDADAAQRLLQEEFDDELDNGQIQRISVVNEQSVVAAVGDAMVGQPGVAARYFGALANAGVNVRAVAQGASERNISAVVDGSDAARAIRAVHGAFYLSPQTVSIGIVGVGNVGGALVDQILGEMSRLRALGVELRIRGLATSRRMLLSQRVAAADWRSILNNESTALDLAQFTAHINAEHLPHALIIDCTADEDVAGQHAHWLAQGIHVVTPNKKARAGSMATVADLEQAQRVGRSRYLYETTVGAGLPIIHTLRDLVQTGDTVREIEGVLSGTLAYLFNQFDGATPFSALVEQAWEHGYTEPDPRDDLSGMDVARKLMILVREMGGAIELDDLELEPAVPVPEGDVTPQEFFRILRDSDAALVDRSLRAREAGKVLRYVARFSPHAQPSVRIVEVDESHPFANAVGTDNVVRIVTDRYAANPLVVQGPGAGPDVTAAGVFADVLRLCTALGARL